MSLAGGVPVRAPRAELNVIAPPPTWVGVVVRVIVFAPLTACWTPVAVGPVRLKPAAFWIVSTTAPLTAMLHWGRPSAETHAVYGELGPPVASFSAATSLVAIWK